MRVSIWLNKIDTRSKPLLRLVRCAFQLGQHLDQIGGKLAYLGKVRGAEPLKNMLSFVGQSQYVAAAVRRIDHPHHQIGIRQPADQLRCRVRSNDKPLSKVADRHRRVSRMGLDRKQRLMLLRWKPFGFRSRCTETHEPAQTITKFRKRLIIGLCQGIRILFHNTLLP